MRNTTTEFEIYDDILYFSEDVKKYFKIWSKYYLKNENTVLEIVKIINSNDEEIHKVTRILKAVDNQIQISSDELVKEYIKRDIYDVTVNNILDNSSAYKVFTSLLNDFQKFVDSFDIYSDELKFDIENAYLKAQSNVVGNGFGVLADNVGIASYLISDYHATKKQSYKAQNQFNIEESLIVDKYNKDKKSREIEFLNHVIENIYNIIDLFFIELFMNNIQLLIDVKDIEETNISAFDLKKSNDILTNIEYAKDKRDVIIQAIKSFPGNLEIYNLIAKYGLGFQEIGNLMQFLSVKETIMVQMERKIKSYMVNHSVKESFNHNKNIMDFIANTKNIDNLKYYKIIYQEKYWSIKNKFNSLAKMIKNNKIVFNKFELTEKVNPNESVLKPNIVKDLIGDIDEITIFQNELGYSNLDKELCLLIGETDCNGINEIINKYIDHLYEIILKMIDEENAKKEQERQKVIEEEKQKNKKLKKTKIVFSLIVICFAIIIFYVNVIVPNDKYNQAVELSNSGQYEEAIKIYKELGNYKNSQRLILENKYNLAVEFTNNKQFEKAIEIFAELGDYKDSKLLLGINKFFLPE